MNIPQVLLSFSIVGILGCANAVPIFEGISVAEAISNAKVSMSKSSYRAALSHLRAAKSLAALENAALPSEVDHLRHFATKRRLAEIASDIVFVYHQVNTELTLALADGAILIAKEDGVQVPKDILRIKRRTERHYFEPVFYGVPPYHTTRKIIT